MRPRQPFWRAAALSAAAGAALSLIGLMLMGIPGALLAVPALWIVGLFVSLPQDPFPQQSAWPYVLFVSIFWGAAVPIAWLGTRAAGLGGARRGIAVVLAVVAIGVAIATAFYVVAVLPLDAEMRATG